MVFYTFLRKTSRLHGVTGSFTNLRRLVDFAEDLNYNTLLNHFSRKRATYYEDTELRIVITKSKSLTKGLQKVDKGRGVHKFNI